MLDTVTKKRIDDCRDILVGKLPDPKAQIEQITIGLIYKFMDDMDKEAIELGGKAKFFADYFIPDPENPKQKKKVLFSQYSWDNLFNTKVTAAEMLRLYSEAIAGMDKNPNIPQLFRDIFKNAFLPYRDPETLKLFLKTIGEFEYTHSEKLGDAFEYLLSVMGSQGDAGQFRTPRHIIDFLVALINPGKNDTTVDPACGTAGFLIAGYKHILLQNTKANKDNLNIYQYNQLDPKPFNNLGDKLTPDERKKLIRNFTGYDISPDMVRLSLVNLYLHGFNDPHIWEYDTLSSEERWDETADVILANPPFMSPKGGIRPHKKFSISSNRSEVLFVDYIAEHLNPNGRAGIIVPEGVIFQSGTAYKELRKMLVEKYLYAVVSLPAGVFNPYSGVKTSILLMDAAFAKASNEILFVKIENDGYGLGAQRTPIKGSQLGEAIELLQQFKDGAFTESELAHVVAKNEIAKNRDYNLSGERYKNTGVVNSEFEFILLNELCDLQNGYAFKSEDYIEHSNTLIIRMSNIRPDSGFDIDYNPKYLPDSYANKYSDFLLNDGDVIIAMTDMANDPRILGVPTIVIKNEKNLLLNQRVGRFRNIDKSRIAIPFLKHILNYQFVREYYKTLGGGGLQVNISKKDVLGIKIPLPPLSIQQEIVAEIEGWQKIIDGAKAVVENYKPRFEIDPDWEMVELGEVIDELETGVSVNSENKPTSENQIGILKTSAVTYGVFKPEQHKSVITSERDRVKCSPKKDSIIISRMNTETLVGASAYVDKDYKNLYLPDRLWQTVISRKDVYVKFVQLIIASDDYRKKISDICGGTSGSMKNISKKNFLKLSIPLPPIETQRQIVSQIEKEQALVNANKELIAIFEQKIKDRIAKVWGN